MNSQRDSNGRFTQSRATRLVALALLAAPSCERDATQATTGGHGATLGTTMKAPKPAPAASGLTADGRMRLGTEARCPVCAMPVTEHNKFASAIELTDGRTYYFCGTGCMLRTWLHPEVFLGARRPQLKRAVTRDYFTGKTIDARRAAWVAGSDVIGPMGPAIVPIFDEHQVAAFRSRHGGKHAFKFSELSDELWLKITGKQPGR